ncbi:MAG: hypothetical protein AB1489_15805 [Acidobacteriota bacterium]
MSNPILTALKSGSAPKPARMAAARGMLPLAQEEMLEAMITLRQDPEEDIRIAVAETLKGIDVKTLLPIVQNPNVSLEVLSFLAIWERSPQDVLEAIILNKLTPDEAIAQLAARPVSASLLEAITINQQRLIRHPAIIEAILVNPNRSPEAERRAREVKVEFFEKEFGVTRVAEEQKARARLAQALGAQISEEEFQQVLTQFEVDSGVKIEDGDSLLLDPEAELRRFIYEAELEGEEITMERKSLFQLVAMMTVKERIFLALKGNREARIMLARDSNRLVSSAVLKNPRITEGEVESISNLKGISEEVLRNISMNRAWTSNYTIMHNLVRNPRTPLTFTMSFLNRLQLRDLKALGKNRGIPDVLRNMANRLALQRQQG